MLNVKLIKIKLGLLINYEGYKLRLTDIIKRIVAGILVYGKIIDKINKFIIFKVANIVSLLIIIWYNSYQLSGIPSLMKKTINLC